MLQVAIVNEELGKEGRPYNLVDEDPEELVIH